MAPEQKFTGSNRSAVGKLNAMEGRVGQTEADVRRLASRPLNDGQILERVPSQVLFLAMMTGNDGDPSDDNRWKYSWTEIRKIKKGYPATPGTVDNFETHADLRSGTHAGGGLGPAHNFIENMNNNTAAHVEGNGVDPANLFGTFSIRPCPTDNIVWMREVVLVDEDDDIAYTEYWFSYVNGVDGGCV